MKKKLLNAMALCAMMLVPIGAAADSYTTEVYDFSSMSVTVTLATESTTSTSGTAVYVASDTDRKLGSGRFAFASNAITSISKNLPVGKRSMTSIVGLGIGDVVIVETSSTNIYLRSKNVSYVGSDGNVGTISTAGASGSEADGEKINSGIEYVVTSGNSFDVWASGGGSSISKVTVKKLATAISEPAADLDYQFKSWYVKDTYTSSLSDTEITNTSNVKVKAETAKFNGHGISRMAFNGGTIGSYTPGLQVKSTPKVRVISVLDVKKDDYVTVTPVTESGTLTVTITSEPEGTKNREISASTTTTPYSYVVSQDGTFDMTTASSSTTIDINYITITKAQDMPIGTSKYRTFSSPWAVDISHQSNFKAYYAKEYNATTKVLTMAEITDGIIPANTGVMLYGESGTFYYTTTDKTISGNLLQPVLSDAQNVAIDYTGNTTYVLANVSGTGICFAQLETASTDMAGKAYLVLPTSASAREITFDFGQGETTGVSYNNRETTDGGRCYNLSGQRVGSDYKGLVIKNGKKYMIK